MAESILLDMPPLFLRLGGAFLVVFWFLLLLVACLLYRRTRR